MLISSSYYYKTELHNKVVKKTDAASVFKLMDFGVIACLAYLLFLGHTSVLSCWYFSTLIHSLCSLRTTLCVRFKSAVVACGVVYAAARRFQVPLPENPPWWKAFDAEKSGIDEVCRVLAHLYSLPKAQYVSVCKDGDFSFSNKSSDSQLQLISKVVLYFLFSQFDSKSTF